MNKPERDPYEGKSETTIIVEMSLDALQRMHDALVEALDIPLGMQETTEAKWKSWFLREASEDQRREQMTALGLPEVARRLGLEQVA